MVRVWLIEKKCLSLQGLANSLAVVASLELRRVQCTYRSLGVGMEPFLALREPEGEDRQRGDLMAISYGGR